MLATAVAVHGTLFAVCSLALANVERAAPEVVGQIYFFAIAAPALILAAPLTPLLWRLHLMHAPGWFAWPKAEGFVLVYVVWVFALLVASLVARSFKP